MPEYVTITDTILDVNNVPDNGLLKVIIPTSIATNAGHVVLKGERTFKVIDGQIFDYSGTGPALVPVAVNSYPVVSLQVQFKRSTSAKWVNIGYLVTPDQVGPVELSQWILAATIGPTYAAPVATINGLKGIITLTGPNVTVNAQTNEINIGNGMNWMSAWDMTTSYVKGDVVKYLGNLYIAKVEVTVATNPVTNTAQWELML